MCQSPRHLRSTSVCRALFQIVACARLNVYHSFEDSSRDVALWRRVGKRLPMPTADLGRLVVASSCRGRGVAQVTRRSGNCRTTRVVLLVLPCRCPMFVRVFVAQLCGVQYLTFEYWTLSFFLCLWSLTFPSR